ncbi:MAG: polysaccharide biosynthesis tyrosine autokinase [Chloroherpetonaceae bacterium]|nr:polysaccharide biosynthesis tyrosine autokinase [Chloroherpetonaceae bacterium]MDW8437132.1 polysaccharide biosynthesis tyrosine autokinase [Chloroherpetonaceae bacterium]
MNNANGFNGNVNALQDNPTYRQLQQALQESQSNEFDLPGYLRAFAKGKWIILTVFVSSVLISMFIAYSQPNVYESTTTLILRNPSSNASVIVSLGIDKENQDRENEVQILKSRTLGEEVAYALTQAVYQNPSAPADTLEIIKDGKGGIAPIDVIAARVRSGVEVKLAKGSTFMEVSFRASSPQEAALVSRAIVKAYEERKKKSASKAATALRVFLQEQLEQKRAKLQDSEERLQRYMEEQRVVAIGEESNRMIARYSEALAKVDEAEVMLNALTASLNAYKQEMTALEPKLSDAAVQASTEYYAKLFQQVIAQKQVERDKILSDPNQDNQNVQMQLKQFDAEIEIYKQKLQREFEQQVKQGYANINYPEYYQDVAKKKLATELEIIGVQSRLAAYRKLAEEYDKAFLKTPAKNIEFARLQRNAQTYQELYNLLEKRYQEALIAEEQVPSGVEIVDLAVPNYEPVAPKRNITIMFGIVIGLALGAGVVTLIHTLDRSIHTPEQAEKIGVLLATIPVIETFDENLRSRASSNVKVIEGSESESRKIASHLVTHFDPKSSVSEAYRALRTSLLFSRANPVQADGNKIGSLYAVTSSAPKEGKSTTISNLAITIAQGGQKALLIDCDLRRPILHAVFGYNKEPGITNFLVGRATVDDIIRNSPIRNLDIITSGTIPPNPSELIGSQRMKEFLAEMRARYDIVLIDTPPIIAVTDAQVVATLVDGMLLVVSSGITQTELAKRSKELILKVGGKVVGMVLNNFDIYNAYGSYYKYYRYYNYYYESKNPQPIKKTFLDAIVDRFSNKPSV